MKYEKCMWMTLIQLICLKECCFSNSTQSFSTEGNDTTTTNASTITPLSIVNVTVGVTNDHNITYLELVEIFHGGSNNTNVTGDGGINVTAVTETIGNVTRVNEVDDDHSNTTEIHLSSTLSRNDTFKTNYTVTSEAIASQEGSSFRLQSTGAIAAGVFLVSAVVGYFSCVGYRRFMQKKYGNSQIVAGEDVYDTSDLRYFEI